MTLADRAGLGLVVPHDMVLDRELWRWAPDDVSLFFTRTPPSRRDATLAMIEEISGTEVVAASTSQLLATDAGAYGYACTSCSFIRGVAGERELVEAMQDAGAPVAVTTSGALAEALTALGVGRVAAVTPYNGELTDLFAAYLREVGIDPRSISNLDLTTGIRDVAYDTTADLIRRADRADADAICVACTNLPTYDVIAPLEAELGKPVITANQATMWALLGRVGHDGGPDQRLFGVPTRAAGARAQ